MVGNDLRGKASMDSSSSRAFRRGDEQALAFKPDQERDANGRWTSGGSGTYKDLPERRTKRRLFEICLTCT